MGKKKKQSERRDKRRRTTGSSAADTFFGAEGPSRGRSERHRRKDAQLCAQIRDAVSMVVAAQTDPILAGAWVMDAMPAPHIGHLQILVATPADADVDAVHAKLEAMIGVIRGEVAAEIHRKKTPTLSFVVMRRDPGEFA